MLKLKKMGIWLLLLIITLTMVTGCTKKNEDKTFKGRVRLTNEYMDILSVYNGTSREFTETVKPLEDEKKNDKIVLNEKFWSGFDKDKAKTEEKMGKLKHYEYEFEGFEVLAPSFASYVEKMENYFKVIDEKRQNTSEWTSGDKEALIAELYPIYDEILEQSKDIVHELDVVYNQVFVEEEEKENNQ